MWFSLFVCPCVCLVCLLQVPGWFKNNFRVVGGGFQSLLYVLSACDAAFMFATDNEVLAEIRAVSRADHACARCRISACACSRRDIASSKSIVELKELTLTSISALNLANSPSNVCFSLSISIMPVMPAFWRASENWLAKFWLLMPCEK